MDNDLISRSLLLKEFYKYVRCIGDNYTKEDESYDQLLQGFCELIEKAPIAYDINAVVEEICNSCLDMQYQSESKEAEKIIRKGGIEIQDNKIINIKNNLKIEEIELE